MRGKGRGERAAKAGRRRWESRAAAAEVASCYSWVVIGAKVEVRSDEEGFVGAWFAAEVVHLESPTSCIAEFEELLADDASSPLQELVSFHNLRPCPPALPACYDWLQGHLVEAYDRDGWWAGTVVRSVPDEDKVLVHFRTTGEEISFHASLLRGLQNWDSGKWTDLTQVGRPDNYQEVTAADANGSLSSLHMIEIQKTGCSRSREQFDVDLLSHFPKEVDQVRVTDSDSIPELPVKKIKQHKKVNRHELCDSRVQESNGSLATREEIWLNSPELPKQNFRLELLAYQILVEALRSKGPLKWEQERLLSDVRLHLTITSEEQTFVLKGFKPSQDGRQ